MALHHWCALSNASLTLLELIIVICDQLQQLGSLAAKAAKRRRSSSSTPPPASLPPGHEVGLDLHRTAPVQQPCGVFTALLDAPLQPDNLPQSGVGGDSQYAAVQSVCGPVSTAQPNGSEYYAMPGNSYHSPGSGIEAGLGAQAAWQGVSLGLTPPEAAGARALAGVDLHPPGDFQHKEYAADAPARARQFPAAAVGRPSSSGLSSPSRTLAHPGKQATAQSGNGGQGGKTVMASSPVPVRRGFGGILSGVVKEAAETATKRPPVFRYEDFKTVSRSEASLQLSCTCLVRLQCSTMMYL